MDAAIVVSIITGAVTIGNVVLTNFIRQKYKVLYKTIYCLIKNLQKYK